MKKKRGELNTCVIITNVLLRKTDFREKLTKKKNKKIFWGKIGTGKQTLSYYYFAVLYCGNTMPFFL